MSGITYLISLKSSSSGRKSLRHRSWLMPRLARRLCPKVAKGGSAWNSWLGLWLRRSPTSLVMAVTSSLRASPAPFLS